MTIRFTPLIYVMAAALAAPFAVAEDEARAWKVAAEIGAIATSGNTETITIQGKIDADHNMVRWNNRYTFRVLFKEDQIAQSDGTTSTVKTAERFSASVRSAYKLERENANLFVYGSHTDDQFASYRTYSTLAVGYGTRLYNAETMQLDLEVGPGYYWAEQRFSDGSTVSEDSAIGRAAIKFDWQLTENADFQQVTSVESGPDNTRTTTDTSLSTRINNSMQMKVGFNTISDTDVAPGKEKTDTTTYVNLVYRF